MIEVRNLTYRYPGSARNALDGISLKVPGGAFVAMMGANGSGKSTLARCLNGLLRPLSGEVLVDGKHPDDHGDGQGDGPLVGMVFQNPHAQITSLTVERELAFGLQNLRLGGATLRERLEEHLVSSGLRDNRGASPRSLSAGEQQRLTLAAVLATWPAHLILDEATSLLSPASRKSLLQAVRHDRQTRGTSVLLITQFAGEALEAERLIVLHDGRVALDGPPAELFASAGAMAALGVRVPLECVAGVRT